MATVRSIRVSSLFSITLLGAAGGAINAWLCYAKIPVAAAENEHFKWHVIPAGAAHGAILALVTVGCASWLLHRDLAARLLVAPFIGWGAAYLSWIPLNRSAFDDPWLKSLAWPFGGDWIHGIFMVFAYFGLVTVIYYLWLVTGGLARRALGVHLICACAAGILGSLWWWISWKPWFLSLIHGTIWGMLVGYGTCIAVRAATPEDKNVTSRGVGAGQ